MLSGRKFGAGLASLVTILPERGSRLILRFGDNRSELLRIRCRADWLEHSRKLNRNLAASRGSGSRQLDQMRKKSKKELADEHYTATLPGVVGFHETMLSDGVRNALLTEAITKRVTPTTRFLDIGSGAGTWAILAAKLGARRVVAIEMQEALIPLIFKHAQENGVADRVEIIRGRSDDVRLRGRFDVIVSELFGSSAYGKETVDSFVDLRSRFLAPGGVIIPQKLSLFAVPVHFGLFDRIVPSGVPISTEYVRSIRRHFPLNVTLGERGQIEMLAEPKLISEMDFGSVVSSPAFDGIEAEFEVDDIRRVNAFATFDKSTFDDGIEMKNFESQSWGTMLYPITEINKAGPGTLSFSLRMNDKGSVWSVRVVNENAIPPATYSPTLAGARLKMAGATAPHRIVRPRKSAGKRS